MQVYVDDIYIGPNSALHIPDTSNESEFERPQISVSSLGELLFNRAQSNLKIQVFNLLGILLFEETVIGNTSRNRLPIRGLYVVKSDAFESGVYSQKISY